MSNGFERRGMWWRTMGLTKTHAVGVFVTESVLVTVGIVLCGVAFLTVVEKNHSLAIVLLLGALCAFTCAIAVLLASILSLLFYMGTAARRSFPELARDMEESDPSLPVDRNDRFRAK